MKHWIPFFLRSVSAILSPLAYPDLWFPMDVIQDGILKGRELDAVLQGSPQLTSAVFGNGLMLNIGDADEWANLGNLRHTCFGNPENCPDGFTLSLWLQLGKPRGNTMYIVSSGGQTMYSFGIVLYHRSNHLNFWIKTQLYEWRSMVDVTNVGGDWFHIVLVWREDIGTKMYLNGELKASSSDAFLAKVYSNNYNNMMLGASNRKHTSSDLGSCIIDDIRVWYQVIEANQISLLTEEGFFNLGLKANALITGGKFVKYRDNDTTCTAVQTHGHGLHSSLVEVAWDHTVDMLGLENITVWLSGDARQDYLRLYMATSSEQRCAKILYPCDLNFRTPDGIFWRGVYNCTCPTKDCGQILFHLSEDANTCALTWSYCQPIFICSVVTFLNP